MNAQSAKPIESSLQGLHDLEPLLRATGAARSNITTDRATHIDQHVIGCCVSSRLACRKLCAAALTCTPVGACDNVVRVWCRVPVLGVRHQSCTPITEPLAGAWIAGRIVGIEGKSGRRASDAGLGGLLDLTHAAVQDSDQHPHWLNLQ